MNKKYIELFQEMSKAMAVSAETVAEYDRQHNDEKGEKTAFQMRDDYQALFDKIKEFGEDYVPTKNDCAKFTVAAMVLVNQLQDRMNALKKSIVGYQTDLIPKLQEIVDKATDENIVEMIEEKFNIKDN